MRLDDLGGWIGGIAVMLASVAVAIVGWALILGVIVVLWSAVR